MENSPNQYLTPLGPSSSSNLLNILPTIHPSTPLIYPCLASTSKLNLAYFSALSMSFNTK